MLQPSHASSLSVHILAYPFRYMFGFMFGLKQLFFVLDRKQKHIFLTLFHPGYQQILLHVKYILYVKGLLVQGKTMLPSQKRNPETV